MKLKYVPTPEPLHQLIIDTYVDMMNEGRHDNCVYCLSDEQIDELLNNCCLDDFYNQDDYLLSEEEEKFYKAYEKSQVSFSLYEEESLSQEDAISVLCEDISKYFSVYKIPKFKIKNKEWDLLFDTIYDFIAEPKSDYYDVLSILMRNACVRAMIYGERRITLRFILDQLDCLCDYFSIEKSEYLKNKILDSSKPSIVPSDKFKKKQINKNSINLHNNM